MKEGGFSLNLGEGNDIGGSVTMEIAFIDLSNLDIIH